MKQRILFFHHCGTIGGAGISGLNFLSCIPKDKYEVIIYSVSVQSDMVNLFKENGYEVIAGGVNPVSYTHCVGSEKFALSIKTFANGYRVIKSRKPVEVVIKEVSPDVVIVNSMTLFWIGKIAKKYSIKTACFFRETYIHGLFGVRTSIIKKNLSKYFDKIAFISNYELVRSRKIKGYKKTIYNMVRPDGYDKYTKGQAREKLVLSADKFYILFVGGFNKLKGTKVLLQALYKIKDENINVLFVGGAIDQIEQGEKNKSFLRKVKGFFVKSYNKKCIDYIYKHNLKDKILFFGSQKDVAPFYRAADVLVFPMTAPHQARPLFEAGYAKVPVIITDFENIKELANQNNSYLFKNEDSNDLAQKIILVKENYESAIKKAEVNYQYTVDRHSPEVYKNQIIDFLEQ